MPDLPVTTGTGLPANVAGALAYLLGPITGVAFLVAEKENPFVRFHAAQSIVIGVMAFLLAMAFTIVYGILAFIPFVGWLLSAALGFVFGAGSFLLWVLLMFRAYQGEEWEVPIASEYARRLIAASPA